MMSKGDTYYEITYQDVGKPGINAFGRFWGVTDWIGRIMMQDIGKLVYLRDGILQVENNEQRDNRMCRNGLNPYHIIMEVRESGAIGNYSRKHDYYYARDMRDAINRFIDKWSPEYEFRNAVSVEMKEFSTLD